jgi:hypothetical protein
MVLCGYCGKDVKPNMYLTLKGFICGLGIFYLIYIITKIPQCPNCNFPLSRISMLFAIQPQKYLIKLAGMGALLLTHLKDRVISASRKSYLNRELDPSQPFGIMNTHQTTYFNMTANEIRGPIGLERYRFRK